MHPNSSSESRWFYRFGRDFGRDCALLANRPTPVPWMMNFNEREGRKFSSQAIKVAQEISGQYQTPLQRAVLEGDMEAIYTQAQIELSKRPNESLEENNKSVLHYAVMRRSTDMVLMLIKESQKAGVPIDINKNEIITACGNASSSRIHAVALQRLC